MIEYRFSIRPVGVMKWTVVTAAILFGLGIPQHVGQASDAPELFRPAVIHVPDPAIAIRAAAVKRIYAEMAPRMFEKLEPTEIMKLAEVIVDECREHGIDPLFVLAIIDGESNFDIEAVSPTGARGLMQLIPSTFRQVSKAKRMFDPFENVRAGIRYLAKIRNEYRFRDPETYLFAYNQGPGAVVDHYKNGTPMPEEAERYIPAVMTKYRNLLVKFGFKPREAKKLFLASR